MFGGDDAARELQPNMLVMRVQPNEGVSLNFEVKVPGAAVALTQHVEVAPVDMDFTYAEAFGETAAPAYETLLLDVMIGEATLFTRSDEVEAAWRIIDPLLNYWEREPGEPDADLSGGKLGAEGGGRADREVRCEVAEPRGRRRRLSSWRAQPARTAVRCAYLAFVRGSSFVCT